MNAIEATTFDARSATNAEIVASYFTCGCVPYEDVFTYDRWLAQGMQVQKGEKSCKVPTKVPVFKENEETGEKELAYCRPVTAVLFCRHQVAPVDEDNRNDNGKAVEIKTGLVTLQQAPKPKSPKAKVKVWRQTKPDVWLRKAQSRDDGRPSLCQPCNASEGSYAADGFRLFFVPNFTYPDIDEALAKSFPLDLCRSFLSDGKKVKSGAIVSSRHIRGAMEHIVALKSKTRKAVLDFTGKTLIVSGKNKDATADVTIEDGEEWNGSGIAAYIYEGEPVKMAVNAKYLLAAIKGMKDCVTIRPTDQYLYITDGEREAFIMGMNL